MWLGNDNNIRKLNIIVLSSAWYTVAIKSNSTAHLLIGCHHNFHADSFFFKVVIMLF